MLGLFGFHPRKAIESELYRYLLATQLETSCVTLCGSVVNFSGSAWDFIAFLHFVPFVVFVVQLCGSYGEIRLRMRSTASSVFFRLPKALRRKYPSPEGPKPDPGVPTTCASASN